MTINFPGTLFVATAVTDDRGNFAVRGLAPGTYSLNSEPTGQEVIAPQVQVTGNEAPFQRLTLISGPPIRHLIRTPLH